MKKFIVAFMLALLMVGCSKKAENNASVQSVAKISDLGKDSNYFSGLYGPMKSQKNVSAFDFQVPVVNRMINLQGPFLVQQYTSEKLNVTAIFFEKSSQAIWVKYVLPNPWTQEQINAALGAYSTKWATVDQSIGMNLIMQARAPVVYKSDSDILANKTMFNELVFLAPTLSKDLNKKINEIEQQKRAVPKF